MEKRKEEQKQKGIRQGSPQCVSEATGRTTYWGFCGMYVHLYSSKTKNVKLTTELPSHTYTIIATRP